MTPETVRAILGDPTGEGGRAGVLFLEYPDITATWFNGAMTMLIVESSEVGATEEGVVVGMPFGELERRVGPLMFDEEEAHLWRTAETSGIWYEIARPPREGEEPIDPPLVGEVYAVTDPVNAVVRRIFVMSLEPPRWGEPLGESGPRRGLYVVSRADLGGTLRDLGAESWRVFVLPAGISDKGSFFGAVRATLPLDRLDPLNAPREEWTALVASLRGGLDGLRTQKIALIWPNPSVMAEQAPDEFGIACHLLYELTDSLGDPEMTVGRPTEVMVVLVEDSPASI